MKKILLSLAVILVVGGVVWGVTGAFYNDTEASTGNIFVAGSIDLKVDHTKQTYNGVDCETCSVDIYSSPSTKVVAASAGASNQGPFPMPAVDVSNPHPNWLSESTLSPAQWIWATNPTTVADTTNGATYTFENKFQWNGTVSTVNLNIAFASDNGYKIVLNGVTIVDNLLSEFNYNGSAITLTPSEKALFIASIIPNGENTLQILVRNKPLAGDPVTQNPAGLLFKLNIRRPQQECEADSAFQHACLLWTEKDLGQGDTFFNFNDIKPADWGTNVISYHIDSNDAWMCAFIQGTDLENTLVDPEADAGDVTSGVTQGELSGMMDLFAWRDIDGDGVYEPTSETAIYEGPFGPSAILPIAQPTNLPVPGNTTAYMGMKWCAGNQIVNHTTGAITCDGSGMTDQAQTDSFPATVTMYATQSRNNTDFSCANVGLPTVGDE